MPRELEELNAGLALIARRKNLAGYMRGFVYFEILSLLKLFQLHSLRKSMEYSFAYHANNAKMSKVLQEYTQRNPKAGRLERGALSSIYLEDYEFQYGKVNYANCVVLDVGADIGSTAYFFLEKGARLVVAVEGSEQCFKELKSNAKSSTNIVPVQCFVDNPAQIEALVLRWKPNIVKMDIEGSEIHLFQIEDSIFCSVQEYLIEVHNEELLKALREKCAANGFEVVSVSPQSPFSLTPPYIVNIRKKHN